jgi:uncharacterized protein
MIVPSTYQAPWWLPGGNAQTLYAYFLPRRAVQYRRERVDTPDGDFIDFDWLDASLTAPTLVMFHGLEGSSRSHYALACAHVTRAHGWNFVIPHFRGCSGEPNRTVRAYHSGDVESVEWMLAHVTRTQTQSSICAVGISLGGNALTKFCGTKLGENVPTAQIARPLKAAASICAPLDLGMSGERIAQGFNRVYTRNFLRTMKVNAQRRAQQFPDAFDNTRAQAAHTIAEFDDAYTAPVHGYASVADYYHRASCRPNIATIPIPFLLINALNDPFVPDYLALKAHELSPSVTAEFPENGGHLGFVSGAFPGHLNWLPERLLTFFKPHV